MTGVRESVRPQSLPFCVYPTAIQTEQHGLQQLPDTLPEVDFAAAQPHRTTEYRTLTADTLKIKQLQDMARLVAEAFAKRDPLSRHLHPPQQPPPGLLEAVHSDPFGHDRFGPWTPENIIYWYIRLFLLTDPTSPLPDIQLNHDVLKQSIAVLDTYGQVTAVALNETMPLLDEPPPLRQDDPFIPAVFSYLQPIFDFLGAQNGAALHALYARFPEFEDAHRRGKVGHQLMGARADSMPAEDTFEIVAAALENYRRLAYEYVATEASNQWSGAAYEAIGGVRVHYAPFRGEKRVRQSLLPLENEVTSPDGYIASKDSGSMFYVLRL